MNQTALCTLRDMVLQSPAVAEVFDKLDIDYFCSGDRPLRDALNENGVSLEEFNRQCNGARGQSFSETTVPDWGIMPLRKLVDLIVDKHHAFLHSELPALDKWMADRHSGEQIWPPALHQVLCGLKKDIEVHMRKEETILFPAIVEMETAVTGGRQPQALPFGSVANFSRVLEREHRRTAALLREFRVLTNNYTCPPGAAEYMRMLFRRLQTLATDIQQHIHLENNVLFPRAIHLEKGELPCY